MLISVVIPAYNVESCINRSVSSVLNQSFDDLEVIIIDDGSNDRTPSICDELAKKDKRVKVLHQKNSGVSEARNVGISHSLGNYIFFLDADDLLDLNYFKIVSRELKEGYYSLVCNSYKVVSKLNSNNDMCSYAESKVLNKREALKELFLYGMICWAPFASFYRKDQLKDLQFDKKIKFGEDLLFKYSFIKNSSTPILYIPESGYFYDTTRDNSATNSYTVSKKVDDVLVIKKIMAEEPDFENLVYCNLYVPRILDYALFCDVCTKESDIKICNRFKQEVLKSFIKLMLNCHISAKKKIKIVLLVMPKFLRKLYFKYKKLNLV